MYFVCSDLEGVFVPEIWINVSKQTGVKELSLTTRDISDYNVLMKHRLELLRQHELTLQDIQNVISQLKPLPGALEFVNWIRSVSQLIIVSDTFAEFADPLMKQLGRPTLMCHNLTVNGDGNIVNYNLRQENAKAKVAEALQNLKYKVIAMGDSYNDIAMLKKADIGILFNAPDNVIQENPDLMVINSYEDLKKTITELIEKEEKTVIPSGSLGI